MPVWLSASLGALIRYCLFGIGTFMVSKGYWDQSVADTFVDGALAQILSWLLVIGPIVWAVVVKHAEKIVLFNALLTPKVLTEAEAKAMPAPSAKEIEHVKGSGVIALFLALALASSLTACAKVPAALVAAENAVYTAAAKVDDEFRRVCTDQQLTAPCDDARPFVLELVTAAKNFNRSVAAQHIGGLTDVIAAGGRLAEKVKALPQGRTVQLVKAIGASVAAAAQEAK